MVVVVVVKARVAVLIALAIVVTGACGGSRGAVETARPVTAAPPLPAAPEATVAPPLPAEQPVRAEVTQAEPQVVDDPRPKGSRPAAPSAPPRGKPQPTGRIDIPAIGLSHDTYEGIDLAIINYGPSHWPGTAMPGERGNTVFPGHRTTYSRPFWDIDRLRPGDDVTFTTKAGRFTYRVTESLIVDEGATWITNPTDHPTFTIFACHPKGSARQRYVVKGNLVASSGAATTTMPPTTTTAPPNGGLLPGLLG